MVFEFGSCIRYTFDSTRNLFVRDQGFTVDPTQPREVIERVDSVRVALTVPEVRTILDEADRIGLWSYPADFGDSLTIDAERAAEHGYGSRVPSGRFRVDLRDSDRSAVVRWSDEVRRPLTQEAERLRTFGYAVERLLREKAEAGGLPPAGVVCL